MTLQRQVLTNKLAKVITATGEMLNASLPLASTTGQKERT
jgi:hypothetical protein